MIVTLTRNAEGQRRIYLGGAGSLIAYIQPRANGAAWTLHLETAPTVYVPQDKRAFVMHTLTNLADMLGVTLHTLANVDFDAIAALHTSDPADYRRTPTGQRRGRDSGFVATPPGTTPATSLRPNARATPRRHP